jgi:hypothetical protein
VSAEDILATSLELAVPLRVAELAAMTPHGRERTMREWAQASADAVAHRGDSLLFATKPHKGEGGTADTFNHLARGLAAAAYLPGGVTFLGRLWEAVVPTGTMVQLLGPAPLLMSLPASVAPIETVDLLSAIELLGQGGDEGDQGGQDPAEQAGGDEAQPVGNQGSAANGEEHRTQDQ